MPYTYEYARPAVTVDTIVFRYCAHSLNVLLIRRAKEPYAGHWALPGGFLDEGENPALGAMRELREETGLTCRELTPLGFYGEPNRDPRGHTISLVFYALLEDSAPSLNAADDAEAVAWFNIANLPPLAFDHAIIIQHALDVSSLTTPSPS